MKTFYRPGLSAPYRRTPLGELTAFSSLLSGGEEAGYPFPIPPPRSRPFGPRASALAPGPKERGLASQHDGLGAPLLRLVVDGCAFVV